jgi:Protein of unknown function (DUF664)
MTSSNDERDQLRAELADQRRLFLIPMQGISDEQAMTRSTVSDLTLGGLVKHLAQGERVSMHILTEREGEPRGYLDVSQYVMNDGEHIADLIDEYATAAAATDAIVRALPDLDTKVRLPETPWSPPEPVRRSHRQILLHLLRETCQHSGHADIIRESLDGASTTARMNA